MQNNWRMAVVDILEVFAKQKDLKVAWALEKRPDGCLTVSFREKTENPGTFTKRITWNDFEDSKGDPKVVADAVVEECYRRHMC